jgi:UDP-sugar pyrophosphorylase
MNIDAYINAGTKVLSVSTFGLINLENKFLNVENWPSEMRENESILSKEEKNLVIMLLSEDQHHLFDNWDPPGTRDHDKHLFFETIDRLHKSYNVPGGLSAYLNNAKSLLTNAKLGINPLEGWIPEVPAGVALTPFSADYIKYEENGTSDIFNCGFVLVAGGLGERLGYNGIKVELPVEMTTSTKYLELYCQQLLAMQNRFKLQASMSDADIATKVRDHIPLAIMVSDDTVTRTISLLEENNYFGLEKEQITILKQEKVAALLDSDAHIARLSTYIIDSKPHGHGDVHALMYSSGLARKWLDDGIKWCVFFQDTNALAFHSLPVMLGVSKEMNFQVNSLAIPRVAKQAIGGIAKLVAKNALGIQREMTINVEYNQLDPLLRATVSHEGDISDPTTGMSPYPGNINQLVFSMDSYVRTIEKNHGVMAEFVNPKYCDELKTTFKKPTRLECMMQDFPKADLSLRVGFTQLPSWVCFSPCKNNTADAAIAFKSGLPPGCAFSAESDEYYFNAEVLRGLGCNLSYEEPKEFLGIRAVTGPRIILHPTTAIFPFEYGDVFTNPRNVTISARSSLILSGNVEIRSLNLDGALRVIAPPGIKIIVICSKKNVLRNAGHVLHNIDITKAGNFTTKFTEFDKMRGYILKKMDEEIVSVSSKRETEYVFLGAGVPLTPMSNYVEGSENYSTCSNCLVKC